MSGSEDKEINRRTATEDAFSEKDPCVGFDAIFSYIGGSSRYQWILLSITSLQFYVLVPHHLGFVFLGASPQHWCQASELSRANWTQEEIKNVSIPFKDGQYDQCLMYDLNYIQLLERYESPEEEEDVYSSTEAGEVQKRTCKKWNYDSSIYQSTVVTEFNLVCDDHHYVALIQAAYMIGIVVGTLMGPISDKALGRRKLVLAAVTVVIISGYGASFAKSFITFSVFRFLLGVGVCVSNSTCFALLLEYADKKYRSFFGILHQLPYALGYMTMPVFAYYLRKWDQLQFAFSTFTVVLVLYFWLLPESARWLASRGRDRDDEAIECLKTVAKWNRRELPPREILNRILMACRETEGISKKENKPSFWNNFRSVISNCVDLVRTPELRLRSICIWILYICVSFTYYGSVLDSTNFSTDPFLMVFLGGAMEITSYTLSQPLAAFCGRRPTLMLCFLCTAACNFALVGTSDDQVILQISLSLMSKLFVSSAYGVIYLLGAELYPTTVRMTGMGAATLVGYIGSISSPYAVTLLKPVHPKLPVGVFGGTILCAIAAAWLLPETKDLEMADVVNDVEVDLNFNKLTSRTVSTVEETRL